VLDNPDALHATHWAAFYHFLVDRDTLDIIQRQARTLITEAEDLATWHTTVHGQILRMANSESLFKIRNIWTQYTDTAKMTPAEVSCFTQKFLEEVKDTYDTCIGDSSNVLDGLRSAGPLFLKAFDVSPDQFRRFWQMGVIDQPKVRSELSANPMFAFSAVGGGKFVVHYGTNPLAGFHQATAFVELTGDGARARTRGYHQTDLDKSQKIDRVVNAAKEEFRSWCSAFRGFAKHVLANKSNELCVTHFVGDALSFCTALRPRSSINDTFSVRYVQPHSGWTD
jgi:hypothetical protein